MKADLEDVLFDPENGNEADDEHSRPREVQSVGIVVGLSAGAQQQVAEFEKRAGIHRSSVVVRLKRIVLVVLQREEKQEEQESIARKDKRLEGK